MNKQATAKHITFPYELNELMEVRLNQLGISAPEYVRQLVIQDVKPLYQNIPFVDAATEKSIGLSLQEIEDGDIAEFDSVEDFKAQL